MKKFLLSIVAVFAAMTASAQLYVADKGLATDFDKLPTTKAPKNLVMSSKAFELSQKMNNSARKAAKARDISSLYGDYIWFDAESENDGVDVCKPATISEAPDYSEDGYTYKQVHLEGLAQGYASVDAVVDEDTLIVYPQTCFSYGEYGNMSLRGLVLSDDGTQMGISDFISFVVNEDGNLEMYPGFVGWIIYMDDYATAGGENPYWTLFYTETGEGAGQMFKANGVEVFDAVIGNAEAWETYSNPVYVKKVMNNIKIYGFAGLSLASMKLSSDGVASLPTGQPMIELPSSYVDTEVYGTIEVITGVYVDKEAGTIRADRTIESVDGEWGGNTTVLLDQQYFCIASKPDDDGAAYFKGWYYGYGLVYGDDVTGINTVSASQTTATDNRIFNLAGQQVDKNYKGVVISGGKKYINK